MAEMASRRQKLKSQGAALALAILLLLLLVFLGMQQYQHTGILVSQVPVQHYKDALDDVVMHQSQLCSGLSQLQAWVATAVRRRGRSPRELELISVPIHRMTPSLKVSAKGVVLTSYFAKAIDPIYSTNPGRQGQGHRSSFGYMDLWYRTAAALHLPAVVFHDGLSHHFVKQWGADNIKFVDVEIPEGLYSVNDARFPIFMEWLLCCADVDYVLITDIRDVRFARDPFELMQATRAEYDLYINTDRNNAWMEARFKDVAYDVPQLPVVFNAGVVGGKKEAVLDLLAEMLSEFDNIYKRFAAEGQLGVSNIDMAVLNYVALEKAAKTWRIFTGTPFSGGQAQCELFFQCEYYVYHKWMQPGELPPCRPLVHNLDQDKDVPSLKHTAVWDS